jgi:hypothetical protein
MSGKIDSRSLLFLTRGSHLNVVMLSRSVIRQVPMSRMTVSVSRIFHHDAQSTPTDVSAALGASRNEELKKLGYEIRELRTSLIVINDNLESKIAWGYGKGIIIGVGGVCAITATPPFVFDLLKYLKWI